MPTDAAETPKIITIAEGFRVRQAVDNMGWIDLGDYAIVVDALEQAELEGEVFDAIASTLGDKAVRYVLNTHTHYDHTALNEAFGRRFGAEIVNQRTSPLPPEGRWFQGDRRRVLMLPTPGCHTVEDCIVWAPDEKVLFVGDIFGWGLISLTRNLTDETAALLRQTHAALIQYDAAIVVPGHGPLCATAELRRWLEYFDWLVETISAACSAGKTDGAIAGETAPPDDMKSWWRFTQWKHRDSVKRVLKAIRRGHLTDG